MAEPTIGEVFGSGSTQTLDSLVISKSDLVGLTAQATNTAESMFVSLLLKAMAYLNADIQQTNPDIQVTIETGFQSIIERNGTSYRQRSLNIYLETPESNNEIDPNQF